MIFIQIRVNINLNFKWNDGPNTSFKIGEFNWGTFIRLCVFKKVRNFFKYECFPTYLLICASIVSEIILNPFPWVVHWMNGYNILSLCSNYILLKALENFIRQKIKTSFVIPLCICRVSFMSIYKIIKGRYLVGLVLSANVFKHCWSSTFFFLNSKTNSSVINYL